jgi:hypothetical protein
MGVRPWRGEIAFENRGNKKPFSLLNWLVKAASKDPTRYFMQGIFNEETKEGRAFVATDGRRIHRVVIPGHLHFLQNVPVGKNLAFTADSKRITFTEEIDGNFPDYKRYVGGFDAAEVFEINVSKKCAYTGALYALYSRNVPVNAEHIKALDIKGSPYWHVSYKRSEGRALFETVIADVAYTVVCAGLQL